MEAKEYAINAHKGQRRKSDKEKPMVIHPIIVANILKEYGYDDKVVAAGYLHDTVEDTVTTIDDIEKNFGSDIKSLVYEASEPDKSKSWEERKEHTISNTKNLDIRHKAIICADKIANLEDLAILFGMNGKRDFSAFKRGEEQQKWYYESVYNSLMHNGYENNPMFVRLRKAIDLVFYNKDNFNCKDYLSSAYYNELLKLHYSKLELAKIASVINNKPYVIEFTGTPRTGKTTIIHILEEFFKKGGFTVKIVDEFTTSKYYKEEIYPNIKDKSVLYRNTLIPTYVKENIENAIKEYADIIIVDRGLYDRLIWIYRAKEREEITLTDYNNYVKEHLDDINVLEDIIISTYTDSTSAIKRDYKAHLSLEPRTFLNKKNIDEYNNAFNNTLDMVNNIYSFDTTNESIRDTSIAILNKILADMRVKYLDELNKEW